MAEVTPAVSYMHSRAIDPHVAAELGVKRGANSNELLFPNGRRRLLKEARVLQAAGTQLAGWWIAPPEEASWNVVLVCEGESDALAARSSLPSTPDQTGLKHLPILCVPGTGYPIERFVSEIPSQVGQVLIATDPDMAGNAFARDASYALIERGVYPVRVDVPEPDLAGWLAKHTPSLRGHHLASLICDSQLAAEPKPRLFARHAAEKLRAKADAMELAA